jgi:hypothetical protein
MTENQSELPPQSTRIIEGLELFVIRATLEEIFRNLDLVYDGIVVAADAASANDNSEIETHLKHSVSCRLWEQLEGLSKVIVRFGGSTFIEGSEESANADAQG